jgi:diadenosine tetraphosphatase ApaH/serine/threonine PP2A family protein phosphatase
MRFLVFGDVHANLEALEAVLEDSGPMDGAICLGDLVGYGPNPNECVERVRALPELTCLVGNHDLAAIGGLDLAMFNDYARVAAEWTSEQLEDGTRAFLGGLESSLGRDEFYLAHASPQDPVWEYLEWPEHGPPNFRAFSQAFCFVGHTHVPRVFVEAANEAKPSQVTHAGDGDALALSDGLRRIVNPGGVGQPRDGDPRAAYGIYDAQSGEFVFKRVSYPLETTQRKIRAAGLPAILAYRLQYGE